MTCPNCQKPTTPCESVTEKRIVWWCQICNWTGYKAEDYKP